MCIDYTLGGLYHPVRRRPPVSPPDDRRDMPPRPRAPRVKPKAGYHHGDLRRQLVVAGWRLVHREGADAFRLADAAKLAGVSAAAPYRHFRDRQALLAAIADEGFERLGALASAAVGAHAPGSLDAVCAVGGAYIDFAREETHVFRLMFAPHDGASGDGPSPEGPSPEGPSPEGAAAYDVLVGQVAAHLGLAPDAPPVLATALSLWMYVHGFASLLVDDQLGVGRLEIDVAAMLRANGARMLGAFVS